MERRVNIDVGGVPQPPQLLLCGSSHFPVVADHSSQLLPSQTWIKQSCATWQSRKRRTLRVAVAHTDSSHTGKQVQIPPAIHVPQPLHVSLVDEYWLLVVGDFHGHRATVLPTDLHHPLLGHSLNTIMNRENNKILRIMLSSLYI